MSDFIVSEHNYKMAVNRLLSLMNNISLDGSWDTEFSELMREITIFKKQKAAKNDTSALSSQD